MASNYNLSDSSWTVELSEARPGAGKVLPGDAFLAVAVPDEDPSREPYVVFDPQHEKPIPYEVMRWLMQIAAEEVERVRTSATPAAQTDDD